MEQVNESSPGICHWEKSLPGTLPEPNTKVIKIGNKLWFATSFGYLFIGDKKKGEMTNVPPEKNISMSWQNLISGLNVVCVPHMTTPLPEQMSPPLGGLHNLCSLGINLSLL